MVGYHVPPARGCLAGPLPPWIPMGGGKWGSEWGPPRGGGWRVNCGQNHGFAGAQWAAKKDFLTAPKVSSECLGWG